jgi:hypothetical protein
MNAIVHYSIAGSKPAYTVAGDRGRIRLGATRHASKIESENFCAAAAASHGNSEQYLLQFLMGQQQLSEITF